MGQKVNPIGFRTAIHKNWDSKWFASKENFGEWLHEDLKIRDFIKKKFYHAAISKINIERFSNKIRITVFTARPGLMIGRKGKELNKLRDELEDMVKGETQINIEVKEINKAELNAQLVSENIAMQLERRIGFRRAMKKAIQTAMEMGAEGIKIRCAGRLGGSELARIEQYMDGRTPLHTLRSNIDYGFTVANTTAGKIGIKVWICHKEATEEQSYATKAEKKKVQKRAKR